MPLAFHIVDQSDSTAIRIEFDKTVTIWPTAAPGNISLSHWHRMYSFCNSRSW
jgi:hypothetical protein